MTDSLRFSLREHKCTTYNPDISFTKPTATIIRCTSTTSSLGHGYIFVVAPRVWLHGKYIRFNWQGGVSAAPVVHYVQIYDGSYDRTNDADFPIGSHTPLIKGAGLLQTLRTQTATFGAETVDVQANVAAGTEDKCTIVFHLYDHSTTPSGWQQIDWFEINGGAGGAGNLYSEHFTDSVYMEKTGTTGDYGYISTGEIILTVTIEHFREEGLDFRETKFGATWEE